MAEEPSTPDNPATPPKPMNVQGTEAKKKSDTTRIDLASAKPPPSITDKKDLPADADDYFAMNTMRIEIPHGDMGDAEDVKKKTARIDLSDADSESPTLSSSDVFKKTTVPVGIPTPQPRPAPKPKTLIQVKKPGVKGESIVVSPENTASATEQARKSETARIDLPADVGDDRPATRPKTIRIKRPDGTSGKKALTVARSDRQDRPEPTYNAPIIETEEGEVGVLPAVIAIAALVVAAIVVYMLVAQALGTDLPFPGRI